ncbi:hypothetical protein BC936DRAFT_137951 [Jimgerdemannia flammicorona]|uniref:Uncharacterized protein n=1 Tax=Jimgerdemannia flammicorona TaxID=994334 RepID=A0A433DNC2_9FUNG|nr:hypothetical protein BC936DRAFT_137951 [Jimgerdemannia flammicorona]
MFTHLMRSLVEIGNLEMSSGYDHKEIPWSTWDKYYKDPIGCAHMLEEIENCIKLWQMYYQAHGILQLEQTHKAIVPVSFVGQCKHLFNFVVLLWDLKVY